MSHTEYSEPNDWSEMEESKMIVSSDSDDELEDVPAAIRKSHLDSNVHLASEKTKNRPSRLDAILDEHRREAGKHEEHKALRDQLLTEIKNGAAEEKYEVKDNEDLASEHAKHIEKLRVKSTKIMPNHPGLTVFNADNFCCLFSENIQPTEYISSTDVSELNKIWSMYTPEKLSSLLCSNILSFCLSTSPSSSGIMQWLLDLLSIHHCPVTAYSIKSNMMAILNRQKLRAKPDSCWKPSALALIRLLVNLGADLEELTCSHEILAHEEIRKHLTKRSCKNMQLEQKGKLNSERFRAVLNILTFALQARSLVHKEDLHFVFYMLAKAALDNSLERSLAKDFHLCFAAIISSYSDSDWPAAAVQLCQQLSHVDIHHHNQVYLTSLLPGGPRGNCLQVQLSYTFLYKQLISGSVKLEDSQLQNLQLLDVANLGVPVEKGQPSTLAVKLHELVKEDCYKAYSVLRLLDMAVGDVIYSESMNKKQMEFLLNQVGLVQKTIKDRVSDLDLMKLKDTMGHITVKWSLALQHQRMNERSLFPCATATTHQFVQAEILTDIKEENMTVGEILPDIKG